MKYTLSILLAVVGLSTASLTKACEGSGATVIYRRPTETTTAQLIDQQQICPSHVLGEQVDNQDLSHNHVQCSDVIHEEPSSGKFDLNTGALPVCTFQGEDGSTTIVQLPVTPSMSDYQCHEPSESIEMLKEELEEKTEIIKHLTNQLHTQRSYCGKCKEILNHLGPEMEEEFTMMPMTADGHQAMCSGQHFLHVTPKSFVQQSQALTLPSSSFPLYEKPQIHCEKPQVQFERPQTSCQQKAYHAIPITSAPVSTQNGNFISMPSPSKPDVEIIVETPVLPNKVYLKDPNSAPPCKGAVIELKSKVEENQAHLMEKDPTTNTCLPLFPMDKAIIH